MKMNSNQAIINRVNKYAGEYKMLPKSGYVLCAVSGGADSMCLLEIIRILSEKDGFKYAVLHFNHMIRGEDAERDESFVQEYCASNGITFCSGRDDVPKYAKISGKSTEEAARELRYAFFDKMCENLRADAIATAHHADDNAETVIMNLIRGSSIRGLSGIPPVRGRYIRPLLCLTRSEIEEWLRENDISFVEDRSNFEDIYTRNKLRHRVIPELRKLNPNLSVTLLRNSEHIRRDDDLLREQANEFLWKCKNIDNKTLIDVDCLINQHPAISSRVIRAVAERYSVALSGKLAEEVLKLAGSTSPSSMLNLPGSLRVRREYNLLVFERFVLSTETRKTFMAELISRHWVQAPLLGVELYYEPDYQKINKRFNKYVFKKSELCGKIVVRNRRSGDRIRIAGRNGTKSLKRLFIEMKIPLHDRDLVPVICDEQNIIAIIGVGLNSSYVPDDSPCAAVYYRKLV